MTDDERDDRPVAGGAAGSAEMTPPRPKAAQPSHLVAGVQLRPGGRSLVFAVGKLRVQVGDAVVVPDGPGTAVGRVSVAPAFRPTAGAAPRAIVRLADARDLERLTLDARQAGEAVAVAREQARSLGLPIKVFHAEVSSGRTAIYFASDARVDFRTLVRDLGARLRSRIELRQVGVRDEAKMVGGIGSCGRELCCSTFLPRFAPVSIKMAKHQGLALNPSKVSGQCGRLKCCLVYEEANYVEAAAQLPKPGKRVLTPEGPGRVADLDILRARVRVQFPDRPPKVFEAAELRADTGGDGGGFAGGGATGGAGAPAGARPAQSEDRRGPRQGQAPRRNLRSPDGPE